MNLRFRWFISIILASITCILTAGCHEAKTDDDTGNWPGYNGGDDRNHYSGLVQVTKENVTRLVRSWEYHSGGADTLNNKTQMQCNPIIIDGTLYGVSAGSQAFAIDAASGKELWKTDFRDKTFSMTSRGVTYFANNGKPVIFFGYGQWLYAIDAKSGQPVKSFGREGKINLRDGLTRPGADEYVIYNTPGLIHKDLLITTSRVAEGPTALPGDIRAFNVHTGKLAWTFQTIPANDAPGADTWPAHARLNNGGANNWMGMAIDRKNEILFAPTGSASFDFFGGDRKGNNLYANTLLALDPNTGKRKWHFQLVHHDIWDRDPPAPPNLVTVHKDGKDIAAVAQLTKQGFIFLFNRISGEPVFPIEERPVQRSEMPNEFPSSTQPFPVLPEPFTRQSFTVSDVRTDAPDRDSVLKELGISNTGEAYIPLSRKKTIFFPGTDGGAQWGGAAVDEDNIMYIPAKEVPVYTSLADAPKRRAVNTGEQLYQANCASCHGADRMGDHVGSYPALTDLVNRYSEKQMLDIINQGRGMMPALAHIPESEKKRIIDFLLQQQKQVNKHSDQKVHGDLTIKKSQHEQKEHSKDKSQHEQREHSKEKMQDQQKEQTLNKSQNDQKRYEKIITTDTASAHPYINTGYNRWYSSDGFPVNTPPWGTLTAINLSTGKKIWQVPLGEFKALSEKGVAPTGTDNYGGPLVTATGLIFIAATPDAKIRAFDKLNGKILWEADLPAAGFASASTYSVNGKQYIVIACGGGKLRARSGDSYVAYALPD